MGLDLLRVLEQDPAAVEGGLDARGQAASGERRLETALRELRALLADPADLERRARHFVETLARATAAALLLEHAPSAVAEPFIAGRPDGTFWRSAARRVGKGCGSKCRSRWSPAS